MITTGYEQLDAEVITWAAKNGYKDRIIAIDLETKVINGNFLDNETLLSISVSRRTAGLETQALILEEENLNGELALLNKLDNLLLKIRPVIVVGYNHRGYDTILLSTKRRLLKSPGFWGINDMLERAYMLDLMHVARFVIADHDSSRPKMLSLAKVSEHSLFTNLPLRRTKSLLDGNADRGLQIYELWRKDKETFKRYAEGDSHDTLLIFERIFSNKLGRGYQ